MQQLYFIRHGETDDNRAHHWGHYDTPLNETGREQARRAGQMMRGRGLAFDAIVASPQPRAQQTAQLIAAEIGYPAEAVHTLHYLMERQMGPLCGTPYDAFFEDGKVYRDLDNVDGVEQLLYVQLRAENALHLVRSRHEPRVLVVSHGAFGRAFHRAVMGVTYDDEYTTPQPHDDIQNATLFRLI